MQFRRTSSNATSMLVFGLFKILSLLCVGDKIIISKLRYRLFNSTLWYIESVSDAKQFHEITSTNVI